jgi:hypothetical protein
MPSSLRASSVLLGRHPRRRHRRPPAHLRSWRQTSSQSALARPLLIAQRVRGALRTAVEGALRSQDARSIGGRDRWRESRLASGGVIASRWCLRCLADDMRSRSSSNRLPSCDGKSRQPASASFETSNVPLHFVSLSKLNIIHVIASRHQIRPAALRLLPKSRRARPQSLMPTLAGQAHLAASQCAWEASPLFTPSSPHRFDVSLLHLSR